MLNSDSLNLKRGLVFLFLGLLIFLVFGCGSLQNLTSSGQQPGVAFTPYPPMPSQPSVVSDQQSEASKDGYSLALGKGWSTISFPFNSVLTTSSFDHEIQYYQAGQYHPVNPSTAAPSIDCGKGYWAYQDNAATAIINQGSGPAINSVTLNPGWNLIGLPFSAAKNFADLTLTFNNQTKPLTDACSMDTSAGSQWLYGNVEYYKNSRWYTLRYDRSGSSALSPGVGYWVFSWKDGMTLDYAQQTRNSGPWAKTWGSEDFEFGQAVTTDSAGNIYSAGQGNGNSYLLKYDASGTLLWSRGYGANKFAAIWAICADNLNNVYVGGNCNIGGSRLRAFLVKFSSAGDILWERTWEPTDGWAQISALAVDSQGNVVGCGYTNGWEEDVLVLKYDPDGNLLWAANWGDQYLSDAAYAIAIDPSDNILLTGHTASGGLTDSDVLLMMLDAGGNLLAVKSWGDLGDDFGYGIALDSNQNIFITGSQGSTGSAFLLKYDSQANLVWQKNWSGGYYSQGQAALADSQGNVYLGLESYGDNGGGLILAKYSPDGDALMERSWHSDSSDETLRGMALGPDGNLYLTGYVYSAGNRWQPESGIKTEATGMENLLLVDVMQADGQSYEITGFGSSASGLEQFAGGTDNVLIQFLANYVEPNPRAALTTISPDSGTVGSTVTISGSNLGASGAVTFAGLYGEIINWSSSQIVCLVPENAPLGQVEVAAACNGNLSNTLTFTVQGPQITGLSISSGGVGSTLTIFGSHFSASGAAEFDSAGADIISGNDNQIVCLVPRRSSPGDAQVTVSAHGKTSNSLPFTVFFPRITDLDPISGPTAQSVTINGANFGDTQGSISFGGIDADCQSWEDSRVVCLVPIPVASGLVKVSLTTAWDCPSNEVDFTVTTPHISGLSPNHGPTGTTVTVSGSGFGSEGAIKILDMSLTQVSWSDSQIVGVVPTGCGTGPAVVTVNGKDSNLDQVFTIDLVVDAPIIDSVSPMNGDPGTTITLTGRNFGEQPGTLYFAGWPGPAALSWAITVITVPLPDVFKGGGVMVVTADYKRSNWAAFNHGVHIPVTLLAPFDGEEGSTYMPDITGRHSLTANGNARITKNQSRFYDRNGNPYGCLYLPGPGDYVSISSSPDLDFGSNDFTLDFWICSWIYGGGVRIISGNEHIDTSLLFGNPDNWTEPYPRPPTPDEAQWNWMIDISYNSVIEMLGLDGGNHFYSLRDPQTPLDIYRDGLWHHYVWMRHNNRFYKVVDGNVLNTDDWPIVIRSGGWIDIGKPYTGVDVFGGCWIDDLRIVNGAALWPNGQLNPPNGPAGLYFAPDPSISRIYPTIGTVGARVTIYGNYFDDYQGNSKVYFAGINAGTAEYWSENEIIIRVPNGQTSGGVTIVVDNQTNREYNNFFQLITPYTANFGNSYYYRSWGGPGWENVVDQALDPQGNVYQLGTTDDYGPNAGSGNDLFLIKYDSAGNLLWQKSWAMQRATEADALAADKDGNVYVTGLGSSDDGNNYHIFLLKYDTSGQLLWQTAWGGEGWEYDYPGDLAVDDSGNIYLAGNYEGELNDWYNDSLVLKFSPDGNLLWQKSWAFSAGVSIAVDSSRNMVYLGGYNDNWGYPDYTDYNFLIKLRADDAGQIWKMAWVPTDNYHLTLLKKIKVDNQGNLYALSSSESYDRGDEIITVKFDSNGNLAPGWPRAWNCWNALGAFQSANDLAVDNQQNIYLTGWVWNNDWRSPYYAENTLLLKYDSSGNLLSQKIWDRDKYWYFSNNGVAVDLDNSGNLFLASNISNENWVGFWPWSPSSFVKIAGQNTLIGAALTQAGINPSSLPSVISDPGGSGSDIQGENYFRWGYNQDILLQRLTP